MNGIKTILHLCADIGSDSYFYQQDPDYEVILVGKDIGVENYIPDSPIHGIIANPPCTEFSTANNFKNNNPPSLRLVRHCLRIIKKTNPKWWVTENPAMGTMKDFIGPPMITYQPWEYGSPWTKLTALWGSFKVPEPKYSIWEDVPKNGSLYIRPGRKKPGLAFLHKSSIDDIEEFEPFKDKVKTDSDFRSLCSQGFAKAFYEANR